MFVIDFILNHKKKLIFISSTIFFYKYFLSHRVSQAIEIYNLVSQMDQTGPEETRKRSNEVEKEMGAVFKFVNSSLDEEYNLAGQIKMIKDKNYDRSQLRQIWELFKENTLLHTFTGLYACRVCLFLSLTSVKSFERIKKETGISAEGAKKVMEKAWELIKSYLKYVIRAAAKRIDKEVRQVNLQGTLLIEDLLDLTDKMRDSLFDFIDDGQECVLTDLEPFLTVLEANIESEKRKKFEITSATTAETEFAYEFYCYMYDVCSSSLCSAVLAKGFEEDVKVLKNIIKENMPEPNMKMHTVLSHLAKIGTEIVSEQNNLFGSEMKTEEFNKFYSAFLDNLVV